MVLAWQPLDLRSNVDELDHRQDPGAVLDALGDLWAIIQPPAWHADAACRGRDDVTWFPERGERVEPALAVCATCPVRPKCAEAGLDERHGIWGGLSPKQRRTARTDGLSAAEALARHDTPTDAPAASQGRIRTA